MCQDPLKGGFIWRGAPLNLQQTACYVLHATRAINIDNNCSKRSCNHTLPRSSFRLVLRAMAWLPWLSTISGSLFTNTKPCSGNKATQQL